MLKYNALYTTLYYLMLLYHTQNKITFYKTSVLELRFSTNTTFRFRKVIHHTPTPHRPLELFGFKIIDFRLIWSYTSN